MNGLRRLLLAAYSLLFAAVCVGLGALAWNQDEQLDINPGEFRFVAFISSGDTEKWAFTALMGCLVLFALLTFMVAVSRGSDPRKGTLRLRQSDGGTVEVTTASVEALLRDELESIPEIRQAYPRVRANGNAVDVDVAAVIEPSASISHVTSVVSQTSASTLREQVGITNLRRPNIRIRYDEVNARPGRGPARARPEAGAPVMPPREVAESEPWPPPPPEVLARPEPVKGVEPDPWPAPPQGMRFEQREARRAEPEAPPAIAAEAGLPPVAAEERADHHEEPTRTGPRWDPDAENTPDATTRTPRD